MLHSTQHTVLVDTLSRNSHHASPFKYFTSKQIVSFLLSLSGWCFNALAAAPLAEASAQAKAQESDTLRYKTTTKFGVLALISFGL